MAKSVAARPLNFAQQESAVPQASELVARAAAKYVMQQALV